jgi:hypothetical protein
MWAMALTICALVALLAALGFITFTAGRLEATLDVLLLKQHESRRALECELERVRESSDVIPA